MTSNPDSDSNTYPLPWSRTHVRSDEKPNSKLDQQFNPHPTQNLNLNLDTTKINSNRTLTLDLTNDPNSRSDLILYLRTGSHLISSSNPELRLIFDLSLNLELYPST